MPYKSNDQKAWMHENKPDIAQKWDKERKDKEFKKFRRDALKRKMG